MKKTIILSFAMLMGLSARCQDTVYESIFGSLYMQWYVAQYWFGDAVTFEELVMTADTLQIDSSVYHCVKSPVSHFGMRGYIYDLYNVLMYSPNEHEPIILIRESEDHSKLYFRPRAISYGPFTYESEEEILIMDLSLRVGDTLDHTGLDHFVEYSRECGVTYDNRYPELRIIADSIYYQEGRKHIRTNLIITDYYGYPCDTLTFIEGIGPTQGLLYWTITFDSYFYERMLCCEKDDIKLYQRDGCYVWIIDDKIDTVDCSTYLVYPNPAHEVIEICGMDNSLHTITLVSLAGQEVYRTSSYNNNVSVNVGSFAAGFYLVCVDGRTIGRMVKR